MSNLRFPLFRIALCFAAFLCAPVFLFAQPASVKGSLQGCPPGSRLVVSNVIAGKLVPADTIVLSDKGAFSLQRQVDQTDFCVLQLLPNTDGVNAEALTVHLLLLPGEKVSLSLAYMPAINFLKVTEALGSDNMSLYRRFNNLLLEATLDPTRQPSLPNDVARLLSDNADNLMAAFLVTFFDNNISNYATLYRKVRDALIPIYPSNDFVRYLDHKISTLPALSAGDPAPDVVLNGPDGKPRRLSDLRGHVVLLDFWASWCRPCRMENPNVVRLYNQYHDRGFEVFSVSLDNNREAWLKAISDDGLVWPNHVSDLRGWSSAGGKLYGISSIPATVLIDPQGNIIARNLRGPALEAKLHELFNVK